LTSRRSAFQRCLSSCYPRGGRTYGHI